MRGESWKKTFCHPLTRRNDFLYRCTVMGESFMYLNKHNKRHLCLPPFSDDSAETEKEAMEEALYTTLIELGWMELIMQEGCVIASHTSLLRKIRRKKRLYTFSTRFNEKFMPLFPSFFWVKLIIAENVIIIRILYFSLWSVQFFSRSL